MCIRDSLNVGSFKTWTRRVLTHSGNTFTYDPVPDWKLKHHDYFLECKLEFLDNTLLFMKFILGDPIKPPTKMFFG